MDVENRYIYGLMYPWPQIVLIRMASLLSFSQSVFRDFFHKIQSNIKIQIGVVLSHGFNWKRNWESFKD